MRIKENVSLAHLTTLEVGGPARYFCDATSENDVFEAVEFAAASKLDLLVLGGGSNMLVADRGFDGLALRISVTGISISGEDVTAAAGEDWDRFVAVCVAQGLGGIENLSGIPGLVGGTPVQNVGAYGQEVSERITEVRCFDRIERKVVTLDNDACRFSYRTSLFNTVARDRYIVMDVKFRLSADGTPNTSYKDLREYFHAGEPSLNDVRDAVLTIRRAKSMVIDPSDPNRRSAGSFFKNPVISRERLGELEQEFGSVPAFPFGSNAKVPAAWLIEKAGFTKGYRHGNAGISTNHTLALINAGGSTSGELVELRDMIAGKVQELFSITLEQEPVSVGF